MADSLTSKPVVIEIVRRDSPTMPWCVRLVRDHGGPFDLFYSPAPIQIRRPDETEPVSKERINEVLSFLGELMCDFVDREKLDKADMLGSAINLIVDARPADEPSAARHFHCCGCDRDACTGMPATALPPKEPSPEWVLRARAEGRAEFLNLLLEHSAEGFVSDCVGEHAIADTGDYGAHWNEDELRQIFKVDDAAYSLIDNVSSTYWAQEARIMDLERAAEPPSDAHVDLRRYFQVHPVAVDGEPKACRIVFHVGVQSFNFGPEYCDNEDHAEWFIEMGIKALRNVIAADRGAQHARDEEHYQAAMAMSEKHRKEVVRLQQERVAPADGVSPSHDACVDIFNDFDRDEVRKLPRSVGLAWEVGRQIAELRAAETKSAGEP